MLRHVVLFKFTNPADADEAVGRLQSLRGGIPALLTLEAGRNVREHPDAWDVSLVTTHTDLDGLRNYQDHPIHQEFVAWLNPRLSQRAVVDNY